MCNFFPSRPDIVQKYVSKKGIKPTTHPLWIQALWEYPLTVRSRLSVWYCCPAHRCPGTGLSNTSSCRWEGRWPLWSAPGWMCALRTRPASGHPARLRADGKWSEKASWHPSPPCAKRRGHSRCQNVMLLKTVQNKTPRDSVFLSLEPRKQPTNFRRYSKMLIIKVPHTTKKVLRKLQWCTASLLHLKTANFSLPAYKNDSFRTVKCMAFLF